jgi:very-short-patch-repair endonuclease
MDTPTETVHRARDMRKRMTRSEVVLWQAVRASKLGYKIRRQHPFGPYVLDFFCKAAALAIEVDGLVHEGEPQAAADFSRDRYLMAHGIRTVRVPAAAVIADVDNVAAKLKRWIERGVQTSNDPR